MYNSTKSESQIHYKSRILLNLEFAFLAKTTSKLQRKIKEEQSNRNNYLQNTITDKNTEMLTLLNQGS